jgi:predicted nucleic acid-binding protein
MSGSILFSLDTNILFYASDPTAGAKHTCAVAITDEAPKYNCILTLQSVGELGNSMIRRRAASAEMAQRIVSAYRRSFPIVAAVESDIDDAFYAHQQHTIPFWDAMLWATARRAGCTLLLSEDFQDGQVLGGVTIRNPFVLSSVQLTALLK